MMPIRKLWTTARSGRSFWSLLKLLLVLVAAGHLLGFAALGETGSVAPLWNRAIQGIELEYNQIDGSGFTSIVSFVTVRDDSGFSVSGLTKDNFEVREDSVLESPITVEEIVGDSGTVTVALVLDRSGSMNGQPLADAKNAASNFVQIMQSQDRAAVVSFNNAVTTDHPFSSDKNSLISAISALQSFGGTAIYDALIHTANLIEPETGRRAIILLTDGRDTNSQNSFQTALDRAVEVGVQVFTIGLALAPGSAEENVLVTIANSTGGLYFRSPSSSELQQIYEAIAALLRNQYKITYTTHNPTTDGSIRHVRIDVEHQGFTAHDTASYRAPDHVVTIDATTADQVNPGREFTLDLEIPASSKYLYHQMKTLSFKLQYDPTYLQVKPVVDQNITAGALFGAAGEHSTSVSVDAAAGLIDVQLTKDPNTGLIEGRGPLAHIVFEAAADMPDSTRLTFEIVDHLATDINDWPIATRAQNLTLYSYGLIVWPGDTNQNGRVELTDVTVLGVHWDRTGDGRPTEADPLLWKAQLAGRYPVRAAAHADADGSGGVNERDLVPIGLNWGKNRSQPDGTPRRTLSPQPTGTVRLHLSQGDDADDYELTIAYSGGASEPIAGTVFHLRYPGGVDVVSVAPGSGWSQSPLSLADDDETVRLLRAGFMLTADATPLTGSGQLVRLEVRSDRQLQATDFALEELALVTPDGRVHELLSGDTDDGLQPPAGFALHPAYPNPFNPATTVSFTLPEAADVEIAVYSLTGQRLRTVRRSGLAAGEHIWRWEARDRHGRAVSSGVYVVQVQALGAGGQTWTAQQKITFMK